MRPVMLTMSAFGSYSGVEKIDFTRIHGGLFLVAGDTGAGKTTIFDAIMYALYDRTSGGKRDGNMMRSQYAPEDVPTYVEYVFSYRGEQYVIKRNPEYMRAGKRKSADGSIRMVRESAKVSLLLPDGTEYPGKKREIDQKIEEIIGLDAGQFSQIAMIAQGDFLKLLHAESKERKKIFSRIFQTQIYRCFQEELRESAKELFERLRETEKDIRREMERVEAGDICGISHAEESSRSPGAAWQELLGLQVFAAEDVLPVLKRIHEKGVEEAGRLEKEEERLQGEYDRMQAEIQKKQESNRILTLLEEAEASLEKLEQKKAEIKELAHRASLGERAELARSLEQQALRTRKEEEKAAEEIRRLLQEKEKDEGQEKNLKELAEKAEQDMAVAEPELLRQAAKLREVLPHFEKAGRLRKTYQKNTEAMARIMEQCRWTSEEYERRYRLFFAEQAGILAAGLNDGEPCPVCGSLHHPKKAVLSGEAPDQKGVDEARTARESAEQKRMELQRDYQKSIAELETEEQILRQYPQGEEAVRKQLEQMESEWKRQKNAVKEAGQRYREKAEENRRKAGRIESLGRERERLRKRFEDEEKSFRNEISRREFADQEEYREAKKWIGGWREKKETVGRYEKEYAESRSRVDTLRRQSAGRKKENLEEEKKKQDKTAMLLREKREQRLHIHGINMTNQSAYRQLSSCFLRQEEIRKEYEVLSNLSRTANGGLTGSVKLDFETYVQRKYFRCIVDAANRRLARMTSESFILQCREISELSSQGQAGLDLDVYDLVTDSVRDVKSLSGGESFMAALSMALGLADIVQHTAGAISLETMFVDEGFGSLDDASRERAIQILKELAGEKGLVGIISHVNELKEQIEWKLYVKKNGSGSTAEWVI